jgi:DNA polymerase bacteriophage-type
MTDPDRAAGPTFAIADIGWIDWETRSDTDLKVSGATRYATEADAIVLAYAIGNGPVSTVKVTAFDGPLRWDQVPAELAVFHERVRLGKAVYAAWNAGFDRAIWNFATVGFPELEPHHIIDVMAQATASGLPPDLAKASEVIGKAVKVGEGKELVQLFCLPKGLRGVRGTPQSHPEEWDRFTEDYARGDILAMRDVFRSTRQLTLAEWREYWAMEAINDRGVCIDVPMVRHAAKLAEIDREWSKTELVKLTNGAVQTVDQVAKMTGWLMARLPAEGQAILTKTVEEVDEETGEVTKPAKLQLTRRRIERLLAYLTDPERDREGLIGLGDLVSVLQIRRYGGSKTPAKFAKMLAQQVDGRLYGQYVFNGAPQTGRASSRGVQIHNLARDVLEHEPDLIDAVADGINYDAFSSLGDDTPVARKLSLLIRPCFVPSGDNVFVWSDWSQIEARIVPWLCDHVPGARARVQIFRDVDADPDLPDLYTRTAAQLSHVAVDQVTKPMRQRGKVAELALGFCGGVGALQQMAAGYGLHFTDAEAKVVVDRWRDANPWAIDYSREIWEAMKWAIRPENASQPIQAGRVWLKFEPQYLGGSLLARLPSGRCLTYRNMHWQDVDVLDEDDKPTGIKRLEMMFSRGYGRVKLWPGMFVENFTQAAAADVLRGTLVRLEKGRLNVRLHTHDECLVECEQREVSAVVEILRALMCAGFDWSEGLPLMSEETIAYCYTKDEGGHGL